MNAPFFTILVPAFSQLEQTRVTVASLLGQSFSDIEVLVCDNWSMDDTFEEFSNHADARVRAMRPPRHGLPSALLELAWPMASGRYVAILAAGDAFVPDALEQFKKVIDQTAAKFLFCRPAEYFDHRLPESDGRHPNAGKISIPSTTGRVMRLPSVGYLASFYSLTPFFSWQPSGHVFEKNLAEAAASRYQGLFRGPTPQAHGWPAMASLSRWVMLVDKPLFVRHQAPRVPLGAASDGSTEEMVFDVHEGWEVDLTELPVKSHTMIAALTNGLWGLQRHPNAKTLMRFGRDEHTFARLVEAEIASRQKNGFRVAPDEPGRVATWRETLPPRPTPQVLANRIQARAWSVAWSLWSRVGARSAITKACSPEGAIAEACRIVGSSSS